MQVRFLEPASIELDDAIEYYEIQLQGLGKKFLDEVLDSIALITQFPDLFPKNSEHTRKAVLRKFPFNIIYTLFKDDIYIIAVAHQNRQPEYWIERF
ncbi:MAG: hypothetical protein B6D44_02400 [Ignavibacteriales bacterium UTCHB2]|jgi:plasmid stabilization system protein ParE|nr:MAG: hypothetical protein B6D44_02400 [Ignavibacteriales bacterium UTCHB2]HQI42399.1 type II toxin-antitoxin system RelE/ParE family toxin [Ignavibacteriaceae bacterium]